MFLELGDSYVKYKNKEVDVTELCAVFIYT